MPTIRFIIDDARGAAFNMGADSYLLNSCADNVVTVRFYRWEQPTISLGYMQDAERELDLAAMTADGIAWIKRPTGGRAVLHDGDVTYSCAFSKSMAEMGTTIAQTYQLISKCLLTGLQRASINCSTHDTELDVRGVTRDAKLPCFLAPNRDEIMSGGKKLFGSAQKRSANAVLQHGSIPITNAFRKLPKFLRIDDAERERQIRLLKSKCSCVDELASGVTFETLSKFLTDGFLSVLQFDGDLIPWSSQEVGAINDMIIDNAK